MASTDLEKFSRIVLDEFKRMSERFDAIDGRFDQIDKRFDAIDSRMSSIEREITDIHRELDALNEAVANVSGFAKEIDHLLKTFSTAFRFAAGRVFKADRARAR